MKSHRIILILCLLVLSGSLTSQLARAQTTQPSPDISILPGDFTLAGPAARQALVVERLRDGKPAGEITDGVTVASGDDSIVKIEAGVALPVGDGSTTITAKAGDHSATVKVTVRGAKTDVAPSFRNNVQPILAAAGCSSGACHGRQPARTALSCLSAATTTMATGAPLPVTPWAGASCRPTRLTASCCSSPLAP